MAKLGVNNYQNNTGACEQGCLGILAALPEEMRHLKTEGWEGFGRMEWGGDGCLRGLEVPWRALQLTGKRMGSKDKGLPRSAQWQRVSKETRRLPASQHRHRHHQPGLAFRCQWGQAEVMCR